MFTFNEAVPGATPSSAVERDSAVVEAVVNSPASEVTVTSTAAVMGAASPASVSTTAAPAVSRGMQQLEDFKRKRADKLQAEQAKLDKQRHKEEKLRAELLAARSQDPAYQRRHAGEVPPPGAVTTADGKPDLDKMMSRRRTYDVIPVGARLTVYRKNQCITAVCCMLNVYSIHSG